MTIAFKVEDSMFEFPQREIVVVAENKEDAFIKVYELMHDCEYIAGYIIEEV